MPQLIQREDLERESVQQAVERIRRGQALPRTRNVNQLSFEKSTT